MIDFGMLKQLRDATDASVGVCKDALEKAGGDMKRAMEFLREEEGKIAEKKSTRLTGIGIVEAYVHTTQRVGDLLEIRSETDFVARNQQFREFVRNVAMHVAATNPVSVSVDDVPQTLVERERSVLTAKAREEGKKEEMLSKIVDGQIKKWLAQNVLLEQPYVKNPDLTVGNYLKETIATIGENIVIRRFVRFELGEGLEKKATEDFAAEVAKQVKG
jgi:elongation factor Ts